MYYTYMKIEEANRYDIHDIYLTTGLYSHDTERSVDVIRYSHISH